MPTITGNLLLSRILYCLETVLGISEELMKKLIQSHRKQLGTFQPTTFGLNPSAKLRSIIGTQQSAELTHAQALSQSSQFIKKNNFIENVSADTAGSAKYVSENKNKNKAAIASKLSAKIYNLDVLASNIEDEKGNVTRFLLMGKSVMQPELKKDKYITSFLFKLKSKPAALYSALSGFAIQGVNLTKLQSYPEKNSFTSYFFLCDLDGHIEEPKVQKSLEELGLHCEDFHVLGVFSSDKFREK